MEGMTTALTEEDVNKTSDLFQAILDRWPYHWKGGDSHIKVLYGTGYKGELMVVERAAIGAGVLHGTIVDGTAPYDRPTQPISRPTPALMAGTRHPAIDLAARKKELPAP